MKTINKDADRLYKKWKSVQLAADKLKEELMQHMAQLPKGHTSSFCSYVKPRKKFNTTNAALLAMSEHIVIPLAEPKQDWRQFQIALKRRLDFDELAKIYELYDEKKGYIRSEKVA